MAKKRPLTSPAALYRIEKRLTPKARAAFLAAVKRWQADVAAGKLPDPKALKPLVAVTQEGTRLAGVAAAAQIGALTPGLTIAFNLTNPAAVKWTKTNAARLIKDISSETREAVRQAITRSMSGDLTVQQVARYVREIVGLTSKQEQAVYSFYERAIESGYADADALTEANGYAETLRRYRSEVIARTELLHAENRGQELLWEQSKAAGGLRGLVRIWSATPDEITCPLCGRPDGMDGRTTPIGVPWTLPDGFTATDGSDQVMSPQDAHPQCRCSESLTRGT